METDLSLFDAASRMDQRALVAIFDRYAVELYNYVLRMCSDPNKADNVVGEVFSIFLEQLSAGKKFQSNLRSHLYKMTYRLIADGSRLSRREASLELADFDPDNGNGNHSRKSKQENKMLLDTVILAIKNHMTPDQRHVIVLRYVEGFSLLETAEIIGKKANSVMAIQNRAIENVRKVLDQEARI